MPKQNPFVFWMIRYPFRCSSSIRSPSLIIIQLRLSFLFLQCLQRFQLRIVDISPVTAALRLKLELIHTVITDLLLIPSYRHNHLYLLAQGR